MTGMIRWGYVAPRLGVVSVVCLIVWLSLGPLLYWAMVAAGQSVTKAKVEASQLEASIIHGQLQLHDLEVANPDAPDENLFVIGQADIRIDRNELLRRRLVVREGKLSGVRFNVPRANSGALEGHADDPTDESQESETTTNWLEKFSTITGQEQLEDNLETVRVSKEILDRWPRKYDDFSQRASELKQRIADVKELTKNPELKSLADVEKIKLAYDNIQQIRQQIQDLKVEVQQVRQQVPQDRDRLVTAKNNDVERIHELTKLENLNPADLSQYLLGDEYAAKVQSAIAWLDWGRNYLPSKRKGLKAKRMRGDNIIFPSARQFPDLLIEALAIDGSTELDGQTIQFRGVATGLTHQPDVYGKPAVFECRTDGAAQVFIRATVDRTGESPVDNIKVLCPRLSQPARTLGKADKLAVHVAPSDLQFQLDMNLHGKHVAGDLRIVQTSVALTPELNDKYGGATLTNGLQRSLDDVKNIDVAVDLSGTLKKPQWKLRSNLGKQMAQGFNQAFQGELALRREQLTQKLQGEVDSNLGKLNQLVENAEQAVLGKLTEGDTTIAQLTNVLKDQLALPLPTDQLKLPTKKITERLGSLPKIGDLFQKSAD